MTGPVNIHRAPKSNHNDSLKEQYLSVVRMVEELHRQFLHVMDIELKKLKIEDINNVQSLIIFHLADDVLTVSDFISRGYYLGSNITYNLKKLAEAGYVAPQRSEHDRRSVRIQLTDKGRQLRQQLDHAFNQQVSALSDVAAAPELDAAASLLNRLGRFWQLFQEEHGGLRRHY